VPAGLGAAPLGGGTPAVMPDEAIRLERPDTLPYLMPEDQRSSVVGAGPTSALGAAVVPTEAQTRVDHKRGDLAVAAGEGLTKVVSTAIDAALSLALIVVVTRGLGPSRAGVFFEAIAVMMIGATVAKLGADVGLMRMLSRAIALRRVQDVPRTLAVALVPVLLLSLAIGTAMFVLTPQMAHLLSHRQNAIAIVQPLHVLAVFLPFSAVYAVALAGTRGFGTMAPIALVDNIGKSGMRLIGAAAVVLAGFGTVAVAISWGLPLAITLAVILVWTGVLLRRTRADQAAAIAGAPDRTLASRAARRPSPGIARGFWAFAAPRAFAAIFATLVRYLDTLLVGGLKGAHEAGIYAATSRYLGIGTIALSTMFLVIAPHISGFLARGEHDRAGSLYRTLTAWLVIASWPIYLALATFAPLLLSILGARFVAGQTALVILSLAMLVSMATGPVTAVLLMGGYSLWNMSITIVCLALNVGMNILLIPRYGINGAAIAWATSIVVNNALTLLIVRLKMKLGPLGPGFAIVAAASTACFGVLGLVFRVTLGATAAGFAVYAVTASLLYGVILWRYRQTLEIPILLSALTTVLRRRDRRARRVNGAASVAPNGSAGPGKDAIHPSDGSLFDVETLPGVVPGTPLLDDDTIAGGDPILEEPFDAPRGADHPPKRSSETTAPSGADPTPPRDPRGSSTG
jgi:O-antigen/teichoic acid export membrane protein